MTFIIQDSGISKLSNFIFISYNSYQKMSQKQNMIAEDDKKMETEPPHPIEFKYQMLIFFLGMSSYACFPYCFDIPEAVQTQFGQEPYSLDATSFNFLFVSISAPNIVLGFIGGLISIKLGFIRAICLYILILFIGEGLITWTLYNMGQGWYAVLIIGRFLVGISGFSLIGVNLALISKFTAPKYIPLLVGMATMLPWTFQSLSSVISPVVYDQTKELYMPFFVGELIVIYSLICAILLVFLDRKLSKKLKVQDSKAPQITLTLIKKLGPMMIVFFVLIAFAVSIMGGFLMNGNDMLNKRSGISNTDAGTIVMMILLVNIIASPAWAFLKEKVKHKRRLLPIPAIILGIDLVVLYLLPEDPNPGTYAMAYIGFILLGIWDGGLIILVMGSIPLMVPKEVRALAFSVYTIGLGVGLGIQPIIIGKIIDSAGPDNQAGGYKNCYYLYFGEYVFVIGGLFYLALTNHWQAKLIDTPSSKSSEGSKQNQITAID